MGWGEEITRTVRRERIVAHGCSVRSQMGGRGVFGALSTEREPTRPLEAKCVDFSSWTAPCSRVAVDHTAHGLQALVIMLHEQDCGVLPPPPTPPPCSCVCSALDPNITCTLQHLNAQLSAVMAEADALVSVLQDYGLQNMDLDHTLNTAVRGVPGRPS